MRVRPQPHPKQPEEDDDGDTLEKAQFGQAPSSPVPEDYGLTAPFTAQVKGQEYMDKFQHHSKFFIAQDRPDTTFATMKLCSKMSRPDTQDLKNMKRVGRFLFGRPRVGCLFEWQAHPSALHALAHADWAGDRQSRKSANGGMILHGKHLIKAWTK